eukprot:TRINITY_DN1396_c0_g1_i1.p1 TRINITY_DN1396_c0_g1~~TRINITY_DN1396_c0_g1_i1.p1  ORF type:complete len:946 (+),score=314.56 TRINITY_DN1396_c0_g1_i1:153-2990(+)
MTNDARRSGAEGGGAGGWLRRLLSDVGLKGKKNPHPHAHPHTYPQHAGKGALKAGAKADNADPGLQRRHSAGTAAKAAAHTSTLCRSTSYPQGREKAARKRSALVEKDGSGPPPRAASPQDAALLTKRKEEEEEEAVSDRDADEKTSSEASMNETASDTEEAEGQNEAAAHEANDGCEEPTPAREEGDAVQEGRPSCGAEAAEPAAVPTPPSPSEQDKDEEGAAPQDLLMHCPLSGQSFLAESCKSLTHVEGEAKGMPAAALQTCLSLDFHAHADPEEEEDADDHDDATSSTTASADSTDGEGHEEPDSTPRFVGEPAAGPVAHVAEMTEAFSTVLQRLAESDLDELENEWGDATLTPIAPPHMPAPPVVQDGWVNVVLNRTPLLGADITTHDIIGEGGEVWVNALIRTTWPYVAEHISATLRRVIEPALSNAVTGALRLCSVSLGNTCPALGTTKVARLPDGSLRVDTHATWDAECDIVIDVGPGTSHVGISAGVDSLKLDGELTLLLGPPCPTPPYFNALQLYFPNTPDVVLRLTGLGMVASSLPGVTDAIHNAVSDALAAVAVLPNRVGIVINPSLTPLEAARSRCSPPLGALRIEVRDVSVVGRTPTLFGWSEDAVQATAITVAVGSTERTVAVDAPRGDGAAFLVFSDAQLVTLRALDDAGRVLATASAKVADLCNNTEVKFDPVGTAVLECAWQKVARPDEPAEPSEAGTMDDYDTLTPEGGRAVPSFEDVDPPPLPPQAASMIVVELGAMHVQPPAADTDLTERMKVRVVANGVAVHTSAAGGARWTRGDQSSRNQLLVDTLHRVEELGLPTETAADVLGLPVRLVEEYRALEEHEEGDAADARQAWLDEARRVHEALTALSAPTFAEGVYCLVPGDAGAVTFELVSAKTGTCYATHTADIPADGVVEGPFAFTPTGEGVGRDVCSLTARVLRSQITF